MGFWINTLRPGSATGPGTLRHGHCLWQFLIGEIGKILMKFLNLFFWKIGNFGKIGEFRRRIGSRGKSADNESTKIGSRSAGPIIFLQNCNPTRLEHKRLFSSISTSYPKIIAEQEYSNPRNYFDLAFKPSADQQLNPLIFK